jgi:hypothetical protein
MALYVQMLGQVGSGKTFLANQAAHVKRGVVLPFAKDVYRLAKIVKGGEIDKSKREDRDLLTLIGTTWGRQSRRVARDIQDILEAHKPKEWGTADIWARIFIANCRDLPAGTSVFNDDTRFLNELEISISELGFIPIFVACSEPTRKDRLRKRGDTFDHCATDHLSEELANFLRTEILTTPLMPVVWNDVDSRLPAAPAWVFGAGEFRDIIRRSESNVELARELNWTPEHARSFILSLSQTVSDSHV